MGDGENTAIQYRQDTLEGATTRPLQELQGAEQNIGHGQSQGYPADIKSFDEYVQDVLQHADKMRAANPGIPLFVFGQSMGGSVTILSALERPTLFAGVIVSAPGIIPAPESATTFRVLAAKALAFFAPRAGVARIETHMLSRDTAKVKAFEEDPLVFHGRVCARLAVQLMSAMERIQREVHNFRTPLLALHGDQDKMALIDGTKLLYQHASVADKQMKIYPGVYHEPLFELEPDAQTARRDIVTWVAERIQAGQYQHDTLEGAATQPLQELQGAEQNHI
ncbi:monoglyceride lipase-like [Branchiostoma floridae]|uniref:Monoglyceride lipase-like n=1 Tax=Branchiostoma floridae TaxID=7739 RepID=A0A9J7MQN7_BRAFL|nr:monoglyceride lipase-like [Branchiostoma floridae]